MANARRSLRVSAFRAKIPCSARDMKISPCCRVGRTIGSQSQCSRTRCNCTKLFPHQRSKTGEKPGQSLNLHPSWCRFIKINSNPPGECNATQNRASFQHQIRGPGHHAPWRRHPPPGMLARLRVLRDLPRPRAKTGPRAKGQTKRPTRRTQGWHDGQMILAITLMTIIAPPHHDGHGPGPDAGRLDAGTALAKLVRRPEPAPGICPSWGISPKIN